MLSRVDDAILVDGDHRRITLRGVDLLLPAMGLVPSDGWPSGASRSLFRLSGPLRYYCSGSSIRRALIHNPEQKYLNGPV